MRLRVYKHASFDRQQTGSSCLEAAIVIPILLLIIAGIVDFSRWFTMHMIVSRLSYETARYAATLPGLEVCSTDNSSSQVCSTNSLHATLIERVGRMLDARGIPRSSVLVTSARQVEKDSSTSAASGGQQSIVKVSIVAPFNGMFFSVLNSVSSKVEAPYLYRNM